MTTKLSVYLLACALTMAACLSACSTGDDEADVLMAPAYSDKYGEAALGTMYFLGHQTITWDYSDELYESDDDFFARTNFVNVNTDFMVTIEEGKLTIDHPLPMLLVGRQTEHENTEMTCYLKGYSSDMRQLVYGLVPPNMEFYDLRISSNGDTTVCRHFYEFSYESQAVVDNYSGELTISLIVAHAVQFDIQMQDEQVAGTGWTLTAKRVSM